MGGWACWGSRGRGGAWRPGSTLELHIVINDMAKVDASTRSRSPRIPRWNVADSQLRDEHQRQKYVPLLARQGARLASVSPSRVRGVMRQHADTAVRRNAHYVLTDQIFITHGGVGEIFVVTAVTEPGKGTKASARSS